MTMGKLNIDAPHPHVVLSDDGLTAAVARAVDPQLDPRAWSLVHRVEMSVRAWLVGRGPGVPADGELTFECRRCGAVAVCPTRDGRMETGPLHGWSFPARHCPTCADVVRANVVETVSPYPKAEEPQ